MSVYFIRDGDLIKIGYSSEVDKRVAAIINGMRGASAAFMGSIPGDRTLEKHLHTVFAKDRKFGEWFAATERLVAFIQAGATSTQVGDTMRAGDRLQQQEERYAEEGAYFIQLFFEGMGVSARDEGFGRLSDLTTIPEVRLRAIHDGQVCPITAGEYVILRMMGDAARTAHLD